MSEITITAESVQDRVGRPMRFAVLVVVLFALIAGLIGYWVWHKSSSTPPAIGERTAATTISLQTLEERYGLHIRLVGVTAAGGMVDFRYKITDKSKATALADYLNDKIMLIAEDGTILRMATGHGMQHETRMEKGVINFHFFANAHNAVKPGRPVTVVIGPVRLEPIHAQ